jgi:hypothetical protein
MTATIVVEPGNAAKLMGGQKQEAKVTDLPIE